MPVYLLTLHAYATWMPDRPQGSVHRKRGYQEPSDDLARSYRANQREATAHFTCAAQRVMIETLLETSVHKSIKVHAVGTDASHLHALCSWLDDREAARLRDRVKHALSIQLNRQVGRRTWFVRGGDFKRVWTREHFDQLCDEYLPSHRGVG